jgi:hypothetical protein
LDQNLIKLLSITIDSIETIFEWNGLLVGHFQNCVQHPCQKGPCDFGIETLSINEVHNHSITPTVFERAQFISLWYKTDAKYR